MRYFYNRYNKVTFTIITITKTDFNYVLFHFLQIYYDINPIINNQILLKYFAIIKDLWRTNE